MFLKNIWLRRGFKNIFSRAKSTSTFYILLFQGPVATRISLNIFVIHFLWLKLKYRWRCSNYSFISGIDFRSKMSFQNCYCREILGNSFLNVVANLNWLLLKLKYRWSCSNLCFVSSSVSIFFQNYQWQIFG